MGKYATRTIGTGTHRREKPSRNAVPFAKLMEEKTKCLRRYGIPERMLRRYVKDTIEESENPAEHLLRKLELRLDNVVYLLSFAKDRPAAREMIRRGLILVNNVPRDDPSYTVGTEDMLRAKGGDAARRLAPAHPHAPPPWLVRELREGWLRHYPHFQELRQPDLDIHAVIVYYTVL